MSRPTSRVPAYRLHKPSGQARAIVNHRHVYLGKYGSDESREKYARLIAELPAASRLSITSKGAVPQAVSINQVILAYWQFATRHYIKDGQSTREVEAIREALRPLRTLYGHTPADEFGPKKLKAIREHMIAANLSRGVINHRVGKIKRLFKWAVAEELISSAIYHGLQAVAGLRFGQTAARETEPIRPVPDLHVAAVLPFVTPHIVAMIMVQRLTGMRAGEVVIMRPCDIDTTGELWTYEPTDHKTRWRGHRKQIPLGPEVQSILESFLDRAPQAFLFSPAESERWRLENRPPYHGRQRMTPVFPSELRRRHRVKEARRRHRAKAAGPERYDTNSYRRAVCYGLRMARKSGFAIPHWHPHQLRHTRATEVRKKYGIEAAQQALCHARPDTTAIYAEKNLDLARQVAKEMG